LPTKERLMRLRAQRARAPVAAAFCFFLVVAATAHASLLVHRANLTTAPGARIIIPVHITDKRIIMWTPYGLTAVPRGVIATFYVLNVGKEEERFTVRGKSTPVLKHGQHAEFTLQFLRRGKYPFSSVINSGSSLRGVLYVI
jgi:hypothetical protein